MRLIAFAFAISIVGCCGKQQYRQPVYIPPTVLLPPQPIYSYPPIILTPMPKQVPQQPLYSPPQPAYFPPETLCPPPSQTKVEKCFKMIVTEDYPYNKGPDIKCEMSWKW